jgi:hypothetical protein
MNALEELAELQMFLTDEELTQIDRDLLAIKPMRAGLPVPDDWEPRVKMTFPKHCKSPFSDRHAEMWEWENDIHEESCPNPFVGIWPRGGGKSTTAEMIVADLGCRGMRRYCLYVRGIQKKADESVANIAGILESPEIERHYPLHADRRVGKYGSSKGWNRERLSTRGGFTVDALGLDTASRGSKVDADRPDIIVFDDIDELHDTPATTQKKIEIITKSILPTGTKKTAILFIQNVILKDGVCAQLADGRADFLALRKVSGPTPALRNFEYEWEVDEESGIRRAVITKGTPTWEGQDLEACQSFIDTWGLSAFIKEAQHEVGGKPAGVSLNFEPSAHLVDLNDEEVIRLVRRGKVFGGIDFGAWRFACSLYVVTPDGKVTMVNEFFSQKETLAEKAARLKRDPESLPPESLSIRARRIHELCVAMGIERPGPKTVRLWGDAANPTDILEINLAWKRGWDVLDENGDVIEHVRSNLRVVAVLNENKARLVAVTRINDALDRQILRFRRCRYRWRLGHNAAKDGIERVSSRAVYEMENWSVTPPKNPDEPQDQNPDDDTADGADFIASMRYALMSWWRPGKEPVGTQTVEDDRADDYDVKHRRFKKRPHLVDALITQPRTRPSVRAPKPRLR